LKTFACKPQAIHECSGLGIVWQESKSADYKRGAEQEEQEKDTPHGLRPSADMQTLRSVSLYG